MTDEAKQAIRERVWSALEEAGEARFPGVRGRIPNFRGAEAAADALAALDEWEAADTLKANPDIPQLPVRARALADDKWVYMAVPRLAERRPFLLLDPATIRTNPRVAATIRGASAEARPVNVEDLPHIDLVVCGSVAVNTSGARVGKGGGYSDLEFALAAEAGAIDDTTVIATTVHPLQILDEDLPETEHDFRVDVIVTPDEVIRVLDAWRPTGLLWDHLDETKIASIPVLAERAGGSKARGSR